MPVRPSGRLALRSTRSSITPSPFDGAPLAPGARLPHGHLGTEPA
jgi:hypothetical protein